MQRMKPKVSFNGRVVQVSANALEVNAYLILQAEYTVVIDSLLLPRDSRFLAEIAHSYGKPVKYLINTHFHSDHCLGNRLIKGENTIQINQENYLNTILSERAMIKPERDAEPIDRKRLTHPEITFEDQYEIDDIKLICTPGHTPDSICLYLPDEKLLFAGDTIINNARGAYSLPYFYWGSSEDLVASLQLLMKLDISMIYSGHGTVLTRKDKIASDLTYLHNLRKLVFGSRNEEADSIELSEKYPITACLKGEKKIAVPKVHELNIRQILSEKHQSK